MYLDNLKTDVLSGKYNEEQLFQKYLVDKETYYFKQKSTPIEEYNLKKEIAQVLGIHLNDIYIIGSGKIGFSIKPENEGREFDGKFEKTNLVKDKSDIDIAIVNTKLFDYIQENIYDWSTGYSFDWDENSYYSKKNFEVSLKYKFLEYLGKGWFRPDYAPQNYHIETKNGKLKDIIKKWSNKLNRKVAFAIYKDWHFFKKYQMETLKQMSIKISKGDI